MDETTLEKLLQARAKIAPADFSDQSFTDQVMAQLPAFGSASALATPLPLLGLFAAMLMVAVAIGTLVAPVHQHDHRHTHQTSAPSQPPAMNGFDSSALLVVR